MENADDQLREAVFAEFMEVMSDARYEPTPEDDNKEIERLQNIVATTYRTLAFEHSLSEQAS